MMKYHGKKVHEERNIRRRKAIAKGVYSKKNEDLMKVRKNFGNRSKTKQKIEHQKWRRKKYQEMDDKGHKE